MTLQFLKPSFEACLLGQEANINFFSFQICHSKSGDINPMKIKSLVEAYVSKYLKHKDGKDGVNIDDIELSPTPKANGEQRVKLKTNR